MNALDFVVIPKVENTIAYIISELDEVDREEFYRLKKVKNLKVEEQQQAEKYGRCAQGGAGAPRCMRRRASDLRRCHRG